MRLNPVKYYPVWIVAILLIFICPYSGTQENPNGNYSVLISPNSIVSGQTFRILITSEKPFTLATVKANGPSGSLDVLNQRKGAGPP